jgi:hypothetical protein
VASNFTCDGADFLGIDGFLGNTGGTPLSPLLSWLPCYSFHTPSHVNAVSGTDGTITFAEGASVAFLAAIGGALQTMSFTNVTLVNYGDVKYTFATTTLGMCNFYNYGTWTFALDPTFADTTMDFKYQDLDEQGAFVWGGSQGEDGMIDATPLNYNSVSFFVNWGTVNIISSVSQNDTHNYFFNFFNHATINVQGVSVYIPFILQAVFLKYLLFFD